MTWNGLAVDELTLRHYVRVVAGLPTRPRINLYAATADCPELRRIAALIAAEGNCTPHDCVVIAGPPPREAIGATVPRSPSALKAPVEGPGKRPTPRGSPQGWVTNDDYPAAAVSAYWTGTTYFRLAIDTSGAVSDCIVTRSSGHAVLDETVCSLLQRRARFSPAENAAGVPVESSWASRFNWSLPSYRSPLESWVRVTRFRIDASSGTSSCKTTAYGPAPAEDKMDLRCGDLAPGALTQANWGGKPVLIEIRDTHLVDGSALPSAPMPAGMVVYSREIRYGIDAGGQLTACRVGAETGTGRSPLWNYDCHSALEYRPEEVARKPGLGVTFTVSILAGPATD